MRGRVPAPCAIFVGREEPRRRIEHALQHVPVVLVCGVPGIGKSTLAFSIAERWAGPAVYRRIADGEPVSRLLDDVRRILARGSVAELDSDDERMGELTKQLDDAQALLVIDDLHRLDPGERTRLVLGLGQLLHRGRMILTTRERPELGTGIDRLELHLTGLDDASGRALWVALDELYQPSPGFEAAWRRVQGNPLLLRQAHRGQPSSDPCTAAIAALGADERRVAGLLTLANVPLSTVGLERVLPDHRAGPALAGLHARLIVDIHANQTCALHDLFRDEVLRTMSADERATCHAELARVLLDMDLDVVTRMREVCRHLGEIDRFEEVTQLLVAHATEIVRHGASRELLRCLEAIPAARRTPIVEIIHARTLGRLLDLRGAYQALEQLFESGTEPRLEVLIGFGPVAMLTGRLAVAERAFTELLARPDLVSWRRLNAQFVFGILRTYQGHGDDGRAFLRRAIASAASRESEGVLLAAEVYCFWLDEREAEATEALRRAAVLLEGSPPTVHSMVLAPAALAIVLAQLGRFDEAEPWLRQLAELLARSSDARSHIAHQTVLATMDYERGARVQAMARLSETAEHGERGGDVIHALRARTYVARLLLVTGRRRQARVMLDEVAARASALGLTSSVQAVERSRQLDPVVQLRAPSPLAPPSAKIGAAVRARCMAALRAACDGDGAAVAAMVAANAPLAIGADYALDRALGHLARAVLARTEGDAALAQMAMAEARREAQAGEADLDLLDELDAELGHLRVVTGQSARLRASYPGAASSGAIVLDGRSHELRIGGRVHALRRQAMLREILYALSARQGRVVSKREVARRLWGERYDPAVHDNRLWANIHRLRAFLAHSGLNIEFVDDGYRLTPPSGFVFLDPA